MTSDDIIRMFEKANGWSVKGFENTIDDLERFANLVAAAEREACAAICDAYGMPDGTSETARLLAHQIRARRQICAE